MEQDPTVGNSAGEPDEEGLTETAPDGAEGASVPTEAEFEASESVRLVGRTEAEGSIRSGRAIRRKPPSEVEGSARRTTEADSAEQAIPRFPSSGGPQVQPIVAKRHEVRGVVRKPGEQVIDIRGSASVPEDAESTRDDSPARRLSQPPIFGEETRPPLPGTSAAPGRSRVPSPELNVERRPNDPDPGEGAGSDIAESAPSGTGRREPFPEKAGPEKTNASQGRKGSSASRSAAELANTARANAANLNTVSFRTRVATGLAVAIGAVVAFAAGPPVTLGLCTVIVLAAAVELFDGLRKAGHRPATLLALLAVGGAMVGAYALGEGALPLVTALLVIFSFIWFLSGISKAAPTSNIAMTFMGFVWTGFLGSYAALLLSLPLNRGLAFLGGAVLVTIAYDTGAYIGGQLIGRHKLAPAWSPNKTWEGLGVGTFAAVVVGALVGQLIEPWSLTTGAILGLTVACLAPLGDLAESMVKRELGVKDMGNLLPGHGGVLDRFDGLLFVLPATYYLVRITGIA